MDANKKSIEYGGFQFDGRRGQWSLADGGVKGAVVKNAGLRITVNGRAYRLNQADNLEVKPVGRRKVDGEYCRRLEVVAVFGHPGFVWRIRFDLPGRGTGVRISASIHNTGRSELVLGNCDLWLAEGSKGGMLRLGSSPETQRIFAFTGGLATQFVKCITADGGKHTSSYFQHIHNPVARKTLFASFLSFDRMNTQFECRYSARRRSADCVGSCLFQNFELGPGAEVESEILRVELADDPYAVLTGWADRVASRYRPRIWRKSPPVGWVGWAWVDKHTEIPELQVERNLRAMRRRLRGFGVDYLWISIANLKDGLPGNWLECSRDAFPHGFDRTLKKIIRAGIKPGLWTGFFYVNEAAEKAFALNRDNLFRDIETGRPLMRGRWLWAYKAGDGAEPGNYALDCSHPQSLRFLKEVYATCRKWGIRYYMLDFLNAGKPDRQCQYHDTSLIRGPGIPRRGLMTVRRATGADTHLLTAAGSTIDSVTGAVDTMRIGMDYGEGRQLQPRFAAYPATYAVNGSFGSCGSPQDNCLQNTAAYFFTHRKLFLNGQNMLTVDLPIPRNEAELSTTLFGMTGSPVMLGDSLDRISEERLAMIKKILPRPTDWPFPADLFQRVYPEDYSRVLVAPVNAGWGEWSVVAVFNLDQHYAATEIDMRALRLPVDEAYRVWDFWGSKYCGCVKGKFTVEVPAGSCRLLRLSAVSAMPAILSTDMHVRQGQLELRDVVWDKRENILRGTAIRPKGEQGNIFVAAPPGWKLTDYTGVFVAKDARDDTLIIRRPLDFQRSKTEWSLAFARLDKEEEKWRLRHAQRRGNVPERECRVII